MTRRLPLWAETAGFALLIALASILFHPGYTTAARDQIFYIANIFKELDPSLFTRDFMAPFNPGRYALFNHLVIFVMQILHIDLYAALLGLSVLFRFTFFASIILLVRRITSEQHFPYLACLLLLSSFILYGTATFTFETELLPRSAAFSLGLLFLVCDFSEKEFGSVLCLLAVMILHSITALPFLLYFYGSVIFRRSLYSWSLRLLPVLCVFVLHHYSPASNEMLWGTQLNPVWGAIIQPRSPSTWISSWEPGAFIHLFASFLMLIIGAPQKGSSCVKYWPRLLFFVAVGVGGLFLAWVGLDYLKLMAFAWLQPGRFLIGLKLISRLAFAYWAYRRLRERSQPFTIELAMVMVLAAFAIEERMIWLGFPLIVLHWAIPHKVPDLLAKAFMAVCIAGALFKFRNNPQLLAPFLIIVTGSWVYLKWCRDRVTLTHVTWILIGASLVLLPRFKWKPWFYDRPELMSLSRWVQQNVPSTSLIWIDPYSAVHVPLRLLAKRDVYVSEKEGSEGIYSDVYAYEWRRRMQVASAPPTLKTARQEQINYVIMNKPQTQLGQEIYGNNGWYVYSIN